MSWVAFILLLLAVSWCAVGLFQNYLKERSIGIEPPQGGGIVFAGLWLGLCAVLIYKHIVSVRALQIAVPAFLISMVAFLEDINKIKTISRLILQVIISYIAYYFVSFNISDCTIFGYSLGHLLTARFPAWILGCVPMFGILWMTHVIARMDKVDGFAITQNMFVFGIGGLIIYNAGIYDLAILMFGLCALMGGFSIWNWPVAKIIMGKSGTAFLGVLLSFIALYTYQWFSIPLEIWGILMMPFLLDTGITIYRQIMAGEHFLEEKPNHAYQRLVQIGYSPVYVLFALILVNSFLAGLALWGYQDQSLLPLLLIISVGMLSFIYALIEYANPMYRRWYTNKDDACKYVS